jgi:8-oxo-dGTP pyrophosphatase MutT (NUDIX family)
MKDRYRKVGVTLLATYKDYILVEKRASGISFGGLWCLPCGHLERDETGIQAVIRETFEETGIMFNEEDVFLFEVITDPKIYNQNVILRYITKSNNMMTPRIIDMNEVEKVEWIKVTDIGLYNWAFNHDKVIISTLKRAMVS